MKMFSFSSVLYVFAIFSVAFCGGCENPQVNSKSFTTLDATIVANIAYISEFEMQCSSGAPATLYADIEGSIVPVSVVGNNKFQVSWSEDTKTSKKGERVIRLFDEDGNVAVRKALRDGEDVSKIEPLFTVSVHHPGAFSGPWLKSESVAVIVSFTIAYLAISSRAKLVA